MAEFDPYAPITPNQEAELLALLAAGRGRHTRERLRKQLRGVSAGEADAAIRRLKGEPPVPVVPAAPADPAATRARITALRERLDSAYAVRAMQPYGLGQRSLLAGLNGNPHQMSR